ncbi:Ribosylnicotinamide kinase [Fulvivirga imtechensis AK7]|uniref:Ribosylnicotinamide kinase n=1 Tax=Fulvivirga imtechensis AK7 TaxID=1237149 RepID=L8JTZ0_9BACT|nr:ATP-binding protein [Fulvivirga imtechensis]ELR71014.1 Ribosylnicotinamide kinase [Fulvivirga imtechensis AK7]
MEENNEQSGRELKKVVVIGPESTGKSSLSSALAAHYQTEWVPEYAREYIDQLQRPYQESDLIEIARGQLGSEDEKAAKSNKLLICDTDLIVIKIWYEHRYGYCPKEILSTINSRKYDLYLLTYIDIPWEDDPQREYPHLMEYFYNLFKSELEALNLPYVVVRGEFEERMRSATRAIDSRLNCEQ